MASNIIILENIRSAYNVGNVIRTADALGRELRLTGYSPSPLDNKKVQKTSLGAEHSTPIKQFDYTSDALEYAKQENIISLAAEITPEALSLKEYVKTSQKDQRYAIVFGNEVEGVLPLTLSQVDSVVAIPMKGVKESLNIGQSTAIFMRAFEQVH